MPPSGRDAGFTLTEILTAALILLLLVAISVTTARQVQERARLAQCLTNLQAVGGIVHIYLNYSDALPSDLVPLGQAFGSLGLDQVRLVCPADQRPGAADSYSTGYVARRRFAPSASLVAFCGRHAHRSRGALLRLDGSAQLLDLATPTFQKEDGTRTRIWPGDALQEGTLAGPAGYSLTISDLSIDSRLPVPRGKPNAPLLVADGTPAGQGATVFVPPGALGCFRASAPEPVLLELIFQGAVVEVRGGRATVTTSLSGSAFVTSVASEGGVLVRHRDRDRQTALLSGASYEVRTPLPLVP